MPVFRPAEPADLDAVVELAAATFPYSAPAGADPENIAAHIHRYLRGEVFTGYLNNPAARLLLAEGPGGLQGYSLLLVEAPSDPEVAAAVQGRPTAELSKCYVRSECFGSGLAAELMRETLDRARETGLASIWLGVSNVNERAKKFYRKHGFEAVGTKHFMFGGVAERDDVLELGL
ncbi:GNAT family N-acetyltransferase [Arthrobacter russicus]|uniref:Ribosomal protein S18 acetylase RimI-like enzyme n=1 Tax=Arthrobacter russicus TaxID=172040 RepID=A0ABU1JE22_9MICC|nr:GNAT family N-acetyltransferase [Arthrobacter russicus]MDR6270400.1 ribosomal protein S18 acetylase RimI-like enzyme [Arthrobacter russicus]